MLRAIRELGNVSVTSAASSPAAGEPTRRDDAERRQLTLLIFEDKVVLYQ
jgi:hypothetical protein